MAAGSAHGLEQTGGEEHTERGPIHAAAHTVASRARDVDRFVHPTHVAEIAQVVSRPARLGRLVGVSVPATWVTGAWVDVAAGNSVGARARDVLASLRKSRSAFSEVLDDLTVGDVEAPEAERWAAAQRLSRRRYRRPVPRKRVEALQPYWDAAIAERATMLDQSRYVVLSQVTASALLVACAASRQRVDYIYLRVDGRRRKVSASGGLVPWSDLPGRFFRQWIRWRVADEVLDDLLPGWRHSDFRRSGPRLEGLGVPAEASAADKAAELDLLALLDVSAEDLALGQVTAEAIHSLLTREESHLLLRLIDGYSQADIARASGEEPATVRQRTRRLREKIRRLTA